MSGVSAGNGGNVLIRGRNVHKLAPCQNDLKLAIAQVEFVPSSFHARTTQVRLVHTFKISVNTSPLIFGKCAKGTQESALKSNSLALK